MPARVEPVNDIMSIPGWADSATPTVGPSPPFTRLNTPAGAPASSSISAKMMALNGATSEGFRTIVQPAARAGATLHAIWLMGQFQGVMKPHTPAGSRMMWEVPISCSNSKVLKIRNVVMKWPRPAGACAALASDIGAPISSLMVAARSPIRRLNTSMILSMTSTRSSRVVRDQVSNAARAAATAASTSAAPPIAMESISSSVAGLITSRVAPVDDATHWPLM